MGEGFKKRLFLTKPQNHLKNMIIRVATSKSTRTRPPPKKKNKGKNTKQQPEMVSSSLLRQEQAEVSGRVVAAVRKSLRDGLAEKIQARAKRRRDEEGEKAKRRKGDGWLVSFFWGSPGMFGGV